MYKIHIWLYMYVCVCVCVYGKSLRNLLRLFKGLQSTLHTHTEVAQSCPTLCDPMDCSPPGSSVHGIFQAWVLEWVAVSFSRRFSWPRDRTWVSHIVGRRFTIWATREVHQKHRRVVVSFKRMSVEIFYRWNLCPRSQLANYMHTHLKKLPEEKDENLRRNLTLKRMTVLWGWQA